MFYKKIELAEGVTLEAELDEEVFTRCPECNKEIKLDLTKIIKHDDFDIYSTAVYCKECSKRLATA